MRGNGFRDGARRHLGHARQTQGVGAGVVGQLVSPTVQPNLSGWHRRQVAARERGGEGISQERGQAFTEYKFRHRNSRNLGRTPSASLRNYTDEP